MTSEIKYCKGNGKFCYSSEAKAMRAMNKYDDIKRYYFCKSCDSWHTTSYDANDAVEGGVIDQREQSNEIDNNIVAKRLKNLKRKQRRKKDKQLKR
jgi:transcriptional regulator NrdR family protein